VQTPVLDHDTILIAVEDHRAEVNACPGGRHAEKGGLMRPLETQPDSEPVSMTDHRLNACREVREGAAPGRDVRLQLFGELATRLIHDIEDAAVECLIDETAPVGLVSSSRSLLAPARGRVDARISSLRLFAIKATFSTTALR
jgi:hypothetical protein